MAASSEPASAAAAPPSRIRYGMVGGGIGAFIGDVHRKAAALDGHWELVCGCLSSSPDKARASGLQLGLPLPRCYTTFEEMIEAESALPAAQRMQAVVIVTPNHTHFAIAKLALSRGFHVVSDKPATVSLQEALALQQEVQRTRLLYALTHAYALYPMVIEARELVRAGRIGRVRKVVVEYPQEWLSTCLERTGHKQAAWRSDPALTGGSSCMGDIGTHCLNLLETITGLEVREVCADLGTAVEGRALDDDGAVLLRLSNGARGVLHASQVAAGEENDLRIRVYGETGGLDWRQEEPNTLLLKPLGGPVQVLRSGRGYLSAAAKAHTRLPSGHPEGLIEAFANLYTDFADAIRAHHSGKPADPLRVGWPGIREAVRGMAFLQAVLKNSSGSAKWTRLEA